MFTISLLDRLPVTIREKKKYCSCQLSRGRNFTQADWSLHQFFHKTLVPILTIATFSQGGEWVCGLSFLFQKEVKATSVWQLLCIDFVCWTLISQRQKHKCMCCCACFLVLMDRHHICRMEPYAIYSCLCYWMN